MPLRDSKISFGLPHVSPTPYPDEVAATLESPQVVMVKALAQKRSSQADVVHGQIPHRNEGSQGNLLTPNLWITLWRFWSVATC